MQYTVEEQIQMLAAGVLTEKQARAYVLRRIEVTPGYAVAEHLGVEEQTVADRVTVAERKIEEAKTTLDALEKIRNQLPEEET